MNCIYKRVILSRLLESFYNVDKSFMGPTHMIVKICKKYGIYGILRNSVISGNYMLMSEWKKLVKQVVNNRDFRRIKLQCQLYKVLDNLKTNMKENTISPWWQHAYRNPSFGRLNITIIRVLLNVERFGFKVCSDCHDMAIDSVEHKMFKCEAVSNEKVLYWNKIIEVCPVQLANEFTTMSEKDQSVFFLMDLAIDT